MSLEYYSPLSHLSLPSLLLLLLLLWLSGCITTFVEGSSILLPEVNVTTTTTAPITLEGIELPVHRLLHHHDHEEEQSQSQSPLLLLKRNGHGLRSFRFLGTNLKMYVASLYTNQPLSTLTEIMNCVGQCPLLFHFVFLRTVSASNVQLAWQKQLEWSVDYVYPQFKRDSETCVNMFGSISKGDAITIRLFNNNDNNDDDDVNNGTTCVTEILEQGHVLKGRIVGTDFQRAFLSMWFGDRAVQEDLKDALLGNFTRNNAHHHHQHRGTTTVVVS